MNITTISPSSNTTNAGYSVVNLIYHVEERKLTRYVGDYYEFKRLYEENKKSSYTVDIEIFANDRTGLLADIIKELSNQKTKLIAVSARANKEKIAITDITVEVENLDELNKVLKALRKVDSVYEVNRKK